MFYTGDPTTRQYEPLVRRARAEAVIGLARWLQRGLRGLARRLSPRGASRPAHGA